MAIKDANGLPIALWTESASTHEVKLAEETWSILHLPEKPRRMIGEKVYDGDPLRNDVGKDKIELVAPHRKNREKKATQEGRKLRRTEKDGRWQAILPCFKIS